MKHRAINALKKEKKNNDYYFISMASSHVNKDQLTGYLELYIYK